VARFEADLSSTSSCLGINFAEDVDQVFAIGLVDNPKHAIPTGVCIEGIAAERSMQDDLCAWQAMRDQPGRAKPTHSGHTEVENHNVGLAGLCLYERLIAIARALTLVVRIVPLQKFAEATADRLVVINDQDSHRARPQRRAEVQRLRYH